MIKKIINYSINILKDGFLINGTFMILMKKEFLTMLRNLLNDELLL